MADDALPPASAHSYLGETSSVSAAVTAERREIKLILWADLGRCVLPAESLPVRILSGPYVAALDNLVAALSDGGGSAERAERLGYLSLRSPGSALPRVRCVARCCGWHCCGSEQHQQLARAGWDAPADHKI